MPDTRGKPKVEQKQFVTGGVERKTGLVAITRPVDGETGSAQTRFDTAADQVVVFYEEHTHGAEIPLDVLTGRRRAWTQRANP